jgi:hypothetical protein
VSHDHFVAQTYLKHWCDPKTGMLRAYSKGGKEFPCYPKDVCREWNWDTNPAFRGNADLLADFRKAFEPFWKPTVASIRTAALSSGDKFTLAGYWAQLTTCTPFWHSHAVELYEKHLLDFLPLAIDHVARENPQVREYAHMALAEGRIVPNVDRDYVKGLLTKHLTDHIIALYQLDWIILRNSTDISFITSDNPSSVFPYRRPMSVPVTRYLPLAPHLAIIATFDLRKHPQIQNRGQALPDLSKPPPGTIRREGVDRKRAKWLNRVVIMNADELVFCPSESRPVRRLVRGYRRFGIAVDHVKIPRSDGYLTASRLVVRQKPKARSA